VSEPTNTVIVNDCWNRIGINGDGTCHELTKVIHCRNCPVYSSAGRSLLDREAGSDYRSEWNTLLAKSKEVQQSGTHAVVIFQLGDEQLALPASVFREVTEMRWVHSLPAQREKFLIGLVNIRGEIQLCISLGAVLGIETDIEANARTHGAEGRMLVVEFDKQTWVFPVNKVHGTHRYAPENLKPPPATVQKAKTSFTRGSIEWEGKTVGCLNDAAVFAMLKGGIG